MPSTVKKVNKEQRIILKVNLSIPTSIMDGPQMHIGMYLCGRVKKCLERGAVCIQGVSNQFRRGVSRCHVYCFIIIGKTIRAPPLSL